MDISFIVSSLWLSGGVRVVVQYANRLTKRGHNISIIVPKGMIDEKIKEEINLKINIVQSKHNVTNKKNPFKLLWLSWEMAKAIPHSDFIIATHTPTTIVSIIAGKLFHKGKIVWFYQDYLEMFYGRPWESWLLRHALVWHDFALTISDSCVQELKSFSSGEVIKVGEGIDFVNTFHPYPNAKYECHGDLRNKVILFIGDSRPRKGMEDMLIAAEKVLAVENNLVLWIVSKENIPIPQNMSSVFYYRPTPNELAKLYSACDIFVSSSWYESFGLPPLEAMACGAAVVTTDSRGVSEFAIDGENCIIVPPKNPDALAKAILKLLSDPELAEKFRRNGPTTASKFDWDSATDRFEAALIRNFK